MLRRLLTAAPLAVALIAPATARATCMQMVTCRPVLPDCTVHVKQEPNAMYPDQPPNEVELWPANEPLSFVQETTTCCHAPGGIGGCSSELRADLAAPGERGRLVRFNEQKNELEVVRDRFTTGRLACVDVPLYTFDSPVPTGDYRIDCLGGGAIKVVPPAELKSATARKFTVTPPVRHGQPPGPPDTTTADPPAESPPPVASNSGCRQTPDAPAPLALLGLAALFVRQRARKVMS